jgi:hypothetical protein
MSGSVRNCNVIVFAILLFLFVLYASDKKAVRVYFGLSLENKKARRCEPDKYHYYDLNKFKL